jgi:hypothetical protein
MKCFSNCITVQFAVMKSLEPDLELQNNMHYIIPKLNKHCTYSYLKQISQSHMGEYYCKPNLCIVIFVNIFD